MRECCQVLKEILRIFIHYTSCIMLLQCEKPILHSLTLLSLLVVLFSSHIHITYYIPARHTAPNHDGSHYCYTVSSHERHDKKKKTTPPLQSLLLEQ
jgi:hypothetical protein